MERGRKGNTQREYDSSASGRGNKRARNEVGAVGGARATDAFSRHELLMQQYTRAPAYGSEAAILLERHEFVRDETKDAMDSSWETRVAIKYYRRLFKEYALADLSRYKEGKVGLRWRTEKEVIVGKGQFICGNKRCDNRDGLHSYEVPFRYEEKGQRKLELVKLRVCPKCARKLFYEKIKEIRRASKKRKKQEQERQRSSGSGDEEGRQDTRLQQAGEASDESDGDLGNDTDADVHQQIERLISGGVSTSAAQTSGSSSAVAAADPAQSDSTVALARKAWVEPQAEERTRDDEIDDYFADLFM